MGQTYLVGIDGSEGSRKAAECAKARAEASGARLVIVFVIEWSPYSFNTPEENDQRHREKEREIEQARTQVLEPLVADLRAGSKVEIEALIRHGQPAEVLNDVAKEVGASEIVVGRLGRSKLASLLFGSVTSNLVQTSPVPVTVVP